MLTPTTTIVDGGSFTERRDHASQRRGRRPTARSSCPQALQVSSDVFFYNVGADLYYARERRPAEVGVRPRDRPPDRDRPPRRGRRACCRRRQWRNQLYKEGNQTDRPWIGGRQRQPRGRPGRPADQPAPDGGRLRGDRQRRRRRAPARRAWRSRTRAAASCRRSTRRRSATSTSTRSTARRSSRGSTWPPSRRAERPTRCSATSRSRWPARRAPRSAPARRTSPGTWRWRPIRTREIVVAATIEQGGFGVEAAAPVARQILDAYYNAHKQEAKAAGGKVPKQGPIQAGSGASGVRGEPLLMVSDAYPRPFDERRAGGAAERGGVLGPRPAAPARRPRADRLQPLHAGRGDGRRHPARPLLLRHPPGDLRGDRASP